VKTDSSDLIEVAKTSSGKSIRRLSWKAKKKFFRMSGYDPCGGQKQFHKSLARTRVLCAGSRFGKSISAAYDVAPNLLLPDNRGWLVGETYTDAEKVPVRKPRQGISRLHSGQYG
jgi:hypothetical protein